MRNYNMDFIRGIAVLQSFSAIQKISSELKYAEIIMMKAKASLRGVSTPLTGIAIFLRYRIFLCLKSSFPIEAF